MNPDQLLQRLRERVIGQDEALRPIVDAYTLWLAGFAGVDRPVAAFLMLGPTGVGKTLTVEHLAEILHGDGRRLIKIHCAEYRHGHEIARLIGAPPGYIGHKETQPRLSQRRILEGRSPACSLALLLFDEIEKAHADLWDLLLGALDKGDLHLGDGSAADLRETMIFLTSNAGSREAAGAAGFHAQPEQKAEGAARRLFSPEFRNRLTAMLTFSPLSPDQLCAVAGLELGRCATRLQEAQGLFLKATPAAVDAIAAAASNPAFGARPIVRAIESLVKLPLARLVLGGSIESGEEFSLTDDQGALCFVKKGAAS